MKKTVSAVLTFCATVAYSSALWAGSSSGGGPAGDSGSSGSEPAMIARILLSLVPGVYFARKAMSASPVPVKKDH